MGISRQTRRYAVYYPDHTHHDGFSDWDTRQSDWKITNTDWKDVKLIVEECRNQGIKLFGYYSRLTGIGRLSV